MQITKEMIVAAWIGWRECSYKNKNALGEDLMRAALEAALGANTVSEDAAEIVKDLMSLSHPMAECMSDGMRLTALIQIANKAAACIEDLAAALRPFVKLNVHRAAEQPFADKPTTEESVELARITLEKWGLK